MLLKAVFLRNFRCYPEALFEFSSGINTIVGPNAKGKTSLLEAIYFFCTGGSFRTTHLRDLIQKEHPKMYLEALFLKQGIEQTIKIGFDGRERKILHNKTPCSSFAGLLGLLLGVVLTPNDASLVKGSPQIRRHFLDLQIAQVDPLYVHHSMRYQRAMHQRNSLLKAKQLSTIEMWENEMAVSGAYIVQQRMKLLHELNAEAQILHQILTDEREPLSLTYRTMNAEGDIAEAYRKSYHKHRGREIILGYTLTGPHKDDFTISIGDKEVRFFASEGQQRSCVAALRFAEWNQLKKSIEEPPLMLIDDLGVSLDDIRRNKLLEHIQSLGQVFLTTTQEPAIASQNILSIS